ncbi:MAG: DUF433 domain-containing protein [Bryobacteraceae bacterium]
MSTNDARGETTTISEYIEERNGGYYVAGTRISLDSVVYCFNDGNAPEEIQKHFTLLDLHQIYGAIAFYLSHKEEVNRYLEDKEKDLDACAIPMEQENPELWARLQRAREAMSKRER